MPIGCRTPDRGEGLSLQEVLAAIKAVLSCLVYIHSKGFVHRDLRWANLIRSFKYYSDGSRLESCNFLVIDFEFAANDGDEMSVVDYIHRGVVPHGANYRASHDLQLVGKLVETWADNNCDITLDQSAQDFVGLVKRVEDPVSAEAALQHPWLN